jgi:hypothetical protein
MALTQAISMVGTMVARNIANAAKSNAAISCFRVIRPSNELICILAAKFFMLRVFEILMVRLQAPMELV